MMRHTNDIQVAIRTLQDILVHVPDEKCEIVLSSSDIDAMQKAYLALKTVRFIEQDIAQLYHDARNDRSEWANGMRKALQMISSTIDETYNK